jgi:heavy metal sensor kinase
MLFARLRPLFRTLRFRLTFWNTAVVLLWVVVSLFLVHEGLEYALLQEIDSILLEETLEMGMAVEAMELDSDAIHKEMDRKATAHKTHGWFVQLLDTADSPLWTSGTTPPPEDHPALSEKSPDVQTVGNYRVAQRRFESKAGRPAYWVRVATSLDSIAYRVRRRTIITACVGVVFSLLAPLGGYWLAGRATKPLAEIIRLAARLRPSDMGGRLKVRGTGDELDQLSQTINGLADRIANYLNRHREFIANAAHELRSPLAAIQASVEVALNSERTSEEYKELLISTMNELNGLTKLVNQLLVLAENDAGTLEIPRVAVRLDQIVEKSVDMFRAVAEDRGIKLQFSPGSQTMVLGDLTRLRQVVNNLIDNSIKFTPDKGLVDVSLWPDPDHGAFELRVADSGPGISPEDLPHVFERFYRPRRLRGGESSRGSGLGLSICKAIVNAHGGRIRVLRTGESGTVFSVTLPAAQSSAEASKLLESPGRAS